MKAIVAVQDKRTWNGMNTRSKTVETKEEAIRWARTIKNRIWNHVTLIDNGMGNQYTI